jgi:hemerythrin
MDEIPKYFKRVRCQSMVWKDQYSIGVPLIDYQHKTFCGYIDQVLEACSEGRARSEIINSFEFLEAYALHHLAAEEQLMIKIDYPEFQIHKSMHNEFFVRIDKLRREFEETGESITMVGEINHLLFEWLVKHITSVDSKLSDYISTNRC